MNTDTSEITEAPPAGCTWRHNTRLEVDDEIFLGNHRIFGESEPFFGTIVDIEEKPKTYQVTFRASHPSLYGQKSTSRLRKDEFTAIRIRPNDGDH